MKVLVLGGVAAGTKVAAKLKRADRSAEVTILNKGESISYAGCGLPYYVGHVIEEKEQLIVNTPQSFSELTGVEVLTGIKAVQVDPIQKKVRAINQHDQSESEYAYDKLVIAVGASPILPPIAGCDFKNVFVMRTPEDAIALRNYIDESEIKRAVVVGAGYIGLEIAENLKQLGIRPFVLDMADQVLSPGLDPEMAAYVENKLIENGVPVVTGVSVTAIEGEGKAERVVTSKKTYKADLVVLSAGIRPNTDFLNDLGLEMVKGTILTNEYGQTSLPDIYAVGDCAMVHHALTGKAVWSPMGSTANIVGRIVAQNLNGARIAHPGVLSTAVCKLPGINVGRTGLSETQALQEGWDPISVIAVVDDKAHYYAGADTFVIKMIADRTSQRLLGLQVIGAGAVDKIVDIAVTGIMLKGTLSSLSNLDLAYAPPFSTAIHPFEQALNILENKLNQTFETMAPLAYAQGQAEEYQILDVCLQPSIAGAPYLNLTEIHGPLADYPLDSKLLLVCNKGKRAYLLQNRLKSFGYTATRVLEGGLAFNDVEID